MRSPGSEVFVTEAEHFKYGGLTNEKVRGLPLYIFEALPEVFSDKVPGTNGWQSFGLIQEPNRPGPVGWSVRTNGYPHLLPNCALCHTATYRVGGEATPRLIVGGVTLQLDFQALLQFLFACAHDARFTDGTLLAVIQRRHSLDAVDTALYGRLLIPVTAGALQLAGQDCGWMNRQPPSGPGRFDAGALLKFNLLRLPYDGAISTSDMLPIWNRRAEQGRWQRWTGGGTNVHEEMMLSAGSLAALVPMLFDEASFQRIAKFLETLSPPKYPLPVAADLAAQGKSVFTARCLECHAAEGISVHGQLTAQRELGTDPEVLQAYDARTVAALHALKEAPLRYPAQQQTDGYKNVSLTGLWARAPYLHNGSVPTLWDLLLPPENRPETFVRGGNEVDATRLGFIAGAAGTQGKPFLFDTRLRGNSNRGHLYGVDLPEADKRALIEFLKTL
ncbi:MAG: cytochrome c [Proteobacteria bacterium]|nr:cytochrome c [Pseudomonadota bacterium]